ncbi:MAG: glycogen-binding domain-containing protein [Polyangiaceae bacterium]|nr:glycogen-binding domain-containing protein [Polyangiaceae bacterium]
MARRTPPGTGNVPVVFRFQPPSPCPFVDLRGEMSHFQQINPMTQRGSGEVEQTLFLETGVFAYKFYGGGQNWWLDPHNHRTRSRNGARNNILVIGGTDEPVLHAPARPFLFVQDSGSVCVRAGLRKGSFHSLSVLWDEGEGHRQTPLHIVASEDEHLLLEAYLPTSAQRFHYAFVLPNDQLVGRQGGAGQMFSVERKDITPAAPDWWRTAVVYTVF